MTNKENPSAKERSKQSSSLETLTRAMENAPFSEFAFLMATRSKEGRRETSRVASFSLADLELVHDALKSWNLNQSSYFDSKGQPKRDERACDLALTLASIIATIRSER